MRKLFYTALACLFTVSPAQAGYDGWGLNDYLQAGTFSSTYSYPITMGLWLNCSAAGWGDTAFDYIMFFSDAADGTNDIGQAIRKPAAADSIGIQSRIGGSSSEAVESWADGTNDDVWIMVTARIAGAASREICINSSTDCTTQTTSRAVTGLDELSIGADSDGTANWLVSGCIVAEVTVWDKELSDAEVDSLWTSAETGPEPSSVASGNCIGHWHLATDQATHVDSDCSGPNMTENGTVSFNADHPTITSGGSSGTPYWYWNADE